jgi:metal-dependent hydrolase (beta-lactamase superfamily II)
MASVEQVILSHGHYDHSCGLMEALKLTGPIDLYLHPESLNSRYNRNSRDPARCHPMNVFGVTFTSASFHANTRESSTSINFDTLSKRRGAT